MLTFSVNENKDERIVAIRSAIESNIGIFRQYNPGNWEDAIQQAYNVALENTDEGYGDIEPYIRKLAATVARRPEGSHKEIVMSITNEDGEITGPYMNMVDEVDVSVLYNSAEVGERLKELYLKYPEDFVKLERLYLVDRSRELSRQRGNTIENEAMSEEVRELTSEYGVSVFYNMLYKFLKKLPGYIKEPETDAVKRVKVVRNRRGLGELTDIPLIRDVEGNLLGIDKTTLTMERNPDYIEWDTIGTRREDIMQIDISPLMDYMYEQVYVNQGVRTKHIEWCDDFYLLRTLGGMEYINIDRDVYMQKIKAELLETFMCNSITTIVAVSPDSVYIRARGSFVYTTIRVELYTGKIIGLPVRLHKKKQK